MATCPECDAEIEVDSDDLEEMEAGDPWDCEACGSRLRVTTLDPLDFESEDADDDDDEEEEKEAKEGDEEVTEKDDADDDFEDDDEKDESEDWDE